MIEKARLEELIKNKQPIYYKSVAVLYPHKWKHGYDIPDKLNCLYKKPLNKLTWYDLEDLFGSKEEKDWHYEFGNITRTETLNLPSWEEVYNDLKNYKTGDFYIVDNNFCSFVYDKGYATPQLFLYTHNEKYNWNATKENYIEACRLVKKLFLGENDG